MNLDQLKKLLVTVGLFVTSLKSQAEIPPHISQVIANQFGYSYKSDLMSREDPVFVGYMHENWREIADNIEWLPLAEGDRVSVNPAFNATVMNFGRTCESLPPLEYLDFFDKMLSLCEEGRIGFQVIDSLHIAGDEKDCFLSVNWEHPRVQRIFARIKKLVPPNETDFLTMLEHQSKGELADTYLENRSSDTPLPQTLPGIQLKRPWSSLILKFERLTGKKVEVPYDPRFNPRPDRERAASHQPSSEVAKLATFLMNPWVLMIVGALAVMTALVLKMSRRLNARKTGAGLIR